MTSINRSIYIGLGGAGIQSIVETKRHFVEQYGKVPPFVQFLGIDMDEAEFSRGNKEGVCLDVSERCFIGSSGMSSFYNQTREHLNWMPSSNLKCLVGAGKYGSGQVRTNGRISFIANYQKVSFSLSRAYQNAFYSQPDEDDTLVPSDNDVRFHIIFSLAGGTGSGCFIDLAYMIRNRYFTNSRNLIGYAILPDIYKEMVPNSPGMMRVCSNSYAALRELDFLMSLNSDSDPYTLDWISDYYDEKSFIRNPRPFSWIYLIGNRNGRVAINSPTQLAQIVGRALFMFSGSMGTGIEATMDTLGNYAMENGRWASSMGLSSVVYDGQAAADVYATGLSLTVIRNLLNEESEGKDSPSKLLNEVGIYDGGYYGNFLDAIGPAKPAFSTELIKDKKDVLSEVRQVCSDIIVKLSEKAERYCSEEGNLASKLESELSRCLKKGKGSVLASEHLLQQVILLTGDLISTIREEMASFGERSGKLKEGMEATAVCMEEEASKSFLTRRKSVFLSLQNELRTRAESYLSNEMEIKRRQFALKVLGRIQETANNHQVYTLQNLRRVLSEAQSYLESELDKPMGMGPETDLARYIRSMDFSESESAGNEFMASIGDRGLLGLTSAEELVKALKDHAGKQWFYKHCQNVSLSEAVRDLSKEAITELFYQALDKSQALIQYDDQLNKPFDSGLAYRMLGLENVEDNPFADATQILCNENHVWTVATGLKSLVLFFTMEMPFPIEIVKGMERWRKEYEIQEEKLSSHIDVRIREKLERSDADKEA